MTALRDYPAAYLHIVGRKSEGAATVEQLAAASMVAERSERLRSAGWRICTWRPEEDVPGATRTPCGWEWDSELVDGWLAHPYRLVLPDKRTIFVAEPYHLDAPAFASMQRLDELGWRVTIRPECALHYPGRTLAVWVQRPSGELCGLPDPPQHLRAALARDIPQYQPVGSCYTDLETELRQLEGSYA